MSTSLITMENSSVMPVMDVQVAIQRRNQIVEFVKAIMVDGTDFGLIPGTNDKKVLLKPGAEKLTTFFGLTKRFEIVERVEDWTGEAHSGEPFFYYLYRCQLFRGDALIAEGDGSCNSFESKYRWRKASRVCPNCGQETIIKGRAEYGGGWLCFAKKGGCGAKFVDGDESIEGQDVGRVPNPDVTDQVNTIQKMAQKRALVAATLLAVNASEFFTQDLEDFDTGIVVEGSFTEEKPAPKPQPKTNGNGHKTNGNGSGSKPNDGPTAFWTYVRENGIDKSAAQQVLSEAKNDFTKALALLEGSADVIPPLFDEDEPEPATLASELPED